MIDTLSITTSDFTYNSYKNACSDCKLYTQHESTLSCNDYNKKFEHLILTDTNGKKINGIKICNKKPLRDTGIVNIQSYANPKTKEECPVLLVRASVPKFLHGTNYYTSSQGDLILYFKELTKELLNMGIKTDLGSAKISRIDCTKNIETQHRFYNYMPILKGSQSERYKSREYGSSTFLLGNKSRQVCCYDKIDCMNYLGESIPMELQDKNIFRCEFRSLNTSTTQSLGIKNMGELICDYDSLHEKYKTNVQKILFNNSDLIQKIDYIDLEQSFLRMKNENLSFDEFIIHGLLQNNSKYIQGIRDNFEYLLELEAQLNKGQGMSSNSINATKSRHRKIWGQRLMYYMGLMNQVQSINIADLYNELYTKLLA